MTYYGRVSMNISENTEVTVKFNELGQLEGLWFVGQKYYPQLDGQEQWITKSKNPGSVPRVIGEAFVRLEEQLQMYEIGKLQDFHIPLSPQGTEFRQIVWQILKGIPYGETTTYGEISKRAAKVLGKATMSAQAVGGAVGHNPISIIIPCHRVVGSDGSLTGYAGGLEKKKWLLVREGVISSIDK